MLGPDSSATRIEFDRVNSFFLFSFFLSFCLSFFLFQVVAMLIRIDQTLPCFIKKKGKRIELVVGDWPLLPDRVNPPLNFSIQSLNTPSILEHPGASWSILEHPGASQVAPDSPPI